jgi:hypothetical protein
MQREASRDTNEAPCDSSSGIRDFSCFLPLPAELHAVRHCGAKAEMPSPPISGTGLADEKGAIKTHAFIMLLNLLGRDLAGR